MNTHFLTILLLVPLFGALAVLFMPRQWANAIRRFSVGVMLVELFLSLFLIPEWVAFLGHFTDAFRFFPTTDFRDAGFHFVEDVPWVESLGIHYKLGVDGISLWLVLLTTTLTPISLYASWTSVDTKVKEYAFSFLLLQVGMLGAFFSLDLFLFYVFWELMLVPMYLIIGIWGGKDRVYAAVKFFLYTMVGSLLMLIAILYVVNQYRSLTGEMTFDLLALREMVLPRNVQLLAFAAFGLAFAIKVPMFPFHTWLPDAHTQAPTGGSVILAAVLLKLGTYGLLRFAMPLFPLATQILGPTIALFGVIGIIYGAYAAWVQKDVKKLVAYSSVSHMGFVALGMFAMTPHGVGGALLQMVNHGVSTGALFILVGVIYERRHTRELDQFGGLAKVMPWYATLFIIVTMSSIGLPGTNGFVGEFMIMSGAFLSRGGVIGLGRWAEIHTLFAATGVIFAAVYMLHAVIKMFWGPIRHAENENLPDLTRREWIALAPLLVLIFWIGLYPRTFLDRAEPAVVQFLTDFEEHYRAAAEDDTLRVLVEPEAAAPTEARLDSPNDPTPVPLPTPQPAGFPTGVDATGVDSLAVDVNGVDVLDTHLALALNDGAEL